MKTTHAGRDIEVIAPANPYGSCHFTINGRGPRDGERFSYTPGRTAADTLAWIKARIDEQDAKGPEGITGSPDWTPFLRPGSWEECPTARGIHSHIKPVGHPCNEKDCKALIAKKAAQRQRRKEKHPAAGALTNELKQAGFEHADFDGTRTFGFRVFANDRHDHRKGVRVVWYEEGHRMPLDAYPGRCPEIVAYLTGKDAYAVDYDDGARIDVLSKTHGVRDR